MHRVLTFLGNLARPGVFLILGLLIGYWLGFTDAFRDRDTLGNRISRLVYRIHPEALSAGVQQRASVIRDTVQRRSGVEFPP